MAKLSLMKNNKKPNLKGNRLKSYISNNEQKIKELEQKMKENEEVLKKLLEQQEAEQDEE